MKIIVSLDSQSVITQPASLRIKAGAFVPVVIAFTRGSQIVSLPNGALVEFSLKPRTQWTGGLLAYLSQFDLTAGNLYTGALNCASASLLGALGLTDSTPLNDLPQIEANAEVTWSIGGQKFRSSTFPIIVESPVTDDTPIPTPDPELYPAPGAIALKSEIPILPDLTPYALKSQIPVVGTSARLNAGVPDGAATLDESGKLIEYQLPDSVAQKSDIPAPPDLSPYALKTELPQVGSAAALNAGVPDGAATLDGSGKLIQVQVPDTLALKSEIPTLPDLTPYALKSEIPTLPDLSPFALKTEIPIVGSAAALNAGDPDGAATLDDSGKLVAVQVPDSIALKSDIPPTPDLTSFALKTEIPTLPDLTPYALKNDLPVFATNTEAEAGIRDDAMMSPQDVTTWFNAKLPGDAGVALLGNNTWGLPDLSNYSGAIAGDGSLLNNLTALQLISLYGSTIDDSGNGNWSVNGNFSANLFSGSFSGDGSQLQNVYAQYANCDQNGNNIANSYAQQWGYYGSLSVGNADWTNSCQYANHANNADSASSSQYASNANSDNWGYQLYGAGNIQSYFFGGNPNPGDVATFDGNYWSPSSVTSLPITVNSASDRFASSGLKTGWLVKQLDNRTLYQVLDPNDYATELGWVPVGPFILIPANSTPLVIDNTSPTLGAMIHCTAGTWSDSPTSYTYQWNRNGSPISGATALAYTLVSADDGASLQCVVTATNAAGTGTDNVVIPLVVLTTPVNTTAPTISPSTTPNVGDTLSLTGGVWTGFGYTTTYQWNRGGTAISGATAATYTLVAADAGQTITCAVTRTNIRGAATVATAATPAVTNLIAENTAIPTLSSTLPFTGLALTCSPGTWNYHPASYSYQWKRSGVAISGATSSTYTVVSGDVGSTISCAVTATNVAGTSGAISTAESSAVTAAAVSPIQGSIASGLIAHWSLDEASGPRFDSTSNGINLTPYTNGGAITNAAGKFGMAANIPAHSYLSVNDSRLAATKTMCGWFKLSATATSYQRLLAGGIQIYSGSSGISWDNSHYSTGIVPAAGQWYFICMVSTGTTFKLWVNKQSFTVQNVTAGSSVIGSGIEIGDPNYESVAMLFDEVACWNRTLTDAEIMTLASA